MVAHVFSPIRDSDHGRNRGRSRGRDRSKGRESYVTLRVCSLSGLHRVNIAKASQCYSKTLSKSKTKTNQNKLPEV